MLPHDQTAGVLGLLAATPPDQIVKDVLVLIHLIAMAVGLGTVVLTDGALLRRMRVAFTKDDLMRVHRAHEIIFPALLVLWASGLGLVWLKTGGDPSLVSPKLAAKLVVVTWLSLTALAMAEIGLPCVGRAVGYPLSRLPMAFKARLAVCAGMSAAGWSTALLLGASGTTYSADWSALAPLLLSVHGGAVLLALLGAVGLHAMELHKARARTRAASAPAKALAAPVETLPRAA